MSPLKNGGLLYFGKSKAPAQNVPGLFIRKDGSVDILPVTPGTYTITFTYTVCGTTVTKTFSLGVG